MYNRIATTFSKISGARQRHTTPLLHISLSSCGPFFSVLFHSFILVSIVQLFVLLLINPRNTALTLRAFWQRRVQFAELISSNSSLTISRYIRLMLLAILNMMMTTPLAVFVIYLGSYGVPLAPWISWINVHYNFSRVDLVPSIIWRSDPAFKAGVELTRWLFPVCAFLFFALFGFASEAQKQYHTLFHKCYKALSLRSTTNKKPSKIPYLPRSVFSFSFLFLLNN